MVLLIAGASCTGKTLLAQRLMEQKSWPYMSIDHLKMGLIKSGITNLTPQSSNKELTEFLWPIVCKIIETNIENGQNLIVEGCYIPFNWQESFDEEYLANIKYCCIIFAEEYIESHFDTIREFSGVVENRLAGGLCSKHQLIADNAYNLKMCEKHGQRHVLIKDKYNVTTDLFG